MEVREATPSELDEAGALTAQVYLADGYADDAYARVLADAAGRAQDAEVLVAVVDGRLVGAVTLAHGGTPHADVSEPGEAEIRMLAVAPEARGQGAGTALVEECVRRAREAGCSVVRLSTQDAMTAAHRVYARLGFTRTPERDWSPVPGLELRAFALPLAFCGLCGEPGTHEACARMLELEPPRYCARCRRRMVVQVHPTGWTARCVEHGTTTSAAS